MREKLENMDLSGMIEVVIRAVTPFADMQRARAAHAASVCVAEPIEDGHGTLSHIMVDPRLAAIAIARGGVEELLDVTTARLDKLREYELDDMHDDDDPILSTSDSQSEYENMDVLLDTTTGAPVLSWQEVISTKPDPSGHFDDLAAAIFDGSSVALADQLPECIMIAAVGRRFGDIVDTGRPNVDGATVVGTGPAHDTADRMSDGNFPTVLRIASAPVRLDRLLAEATG